MALGLRVCSLDDVGPGARAEWWQQAVVIVVATIQSFRIDDAGQRDVYSFPEAFEPHFKYALAQGKGAEGGRDLACLHALPDAVVTPEDVAQDPTGILAGFVGQPRWSLANWLALHRPHRHRGRGAQRQDGQELHGAAAAEPLVHPGAHGHADRSQDQCALPRAAHRSWRPRT